MPMRSLGYAAVVRRTVGIVALVVGLMAASPPAAAQEEGEGEGEGAAGAPAETPAAEESDEERRKRLVRLSSGKVAYEPPVGEVYSLPAMIERTMEVNPQVVAKKYSVLYAELRKKEADWALFPELEFNGRLTYVPEDPDFNSVESNISEYLDFDIGPLFQGSLRIVFPITTFGKISNLEELAELGIDQAELETRKLRLELIRQVKEAYLSVQLGKIIEALSTDGFAIVAEEIVRMDEAREFGDEDVDVVELRRLQIYEAELAEKTIDNERLIRLTKLALGVLTQVEPGTFDVQPFNEDVDVSVLPPLSVCLQITTNNRPDLQLLQKAVVARQRQVDLAVAQFYPDLYFAIDTGFSVSTVDAPNQTGFVAPDEEGDEPIPIELEPLTDPFNYTRLAFALGLRLKINPANQYWKVQEAKTQLAETRALREAALQGVELDVTRKWVEANDHRRKIEILDRRLKAAERWRNQIAIAFEAGGADFQDFVAPLKAYYEARLLLIKAKYDFQVALAHLAEKMGVTEIEGIAVEGEAPAAP